MSMRVNRCPGIRLQPIDGQVITFVVLREKVRAVRRVWDIEGILFEYVCEHPRKATVQETMFFQRCPLELLWKRKAEFLEKCGSIWQQPRAMV